MTRQVNFQTALFENKIVGEHFINDNCFGEDVAAWIVEKVLGSNGGFEFLDLYQEDWGWAIELTRAGHYFMFGIGIIDEAPPAVEAEWVVTISCEVGILKRLFTRQKPDVAGVDELARILDEALKNTPGISEIVWDE